MYSDCVLEAHGKGSGLGDLQCPPPAEFSSIPREAGNIECECTMFQTSIAEAAARSCGCNVVADCHGGNP